jgi:hypothetical protein
MARGDKFKLGANTDLLKLSEIRKLGEEGWVKEVRTARLLWNRQAAKPSLTTVLK